MYTQCTKPLSELYTICTNCIVEATNGFVMRHSMREFVHFSCCVITRVQIVYSRQNHASNVGFAVTDAHWITVSSSRSSQFLCICQMLSKSSGQIYSSHIGSKMFPVSVRLWVYVAETLTRCVRKSGGLEQKIFVLVSHKIGWSMARIHGQYRWRKRRIILILIRESVC